MRSYSCSLYLLLTASLLTLALSAQDPRYVNRLAPYVASPDRVVDTMLSLANIQPGELLYDLGSGDGRILIAAAQRYNARAVGIEITPRLVESATREIERAGVEDRVKVIEGDILNTDFSQADVVTLYLEKELNAKLRPQLERYLKPGARVVSHQYEIPGWHPTSVEKVPGASDHVVYLYRIPEAER